MVSGIKSDRFISTSNIPEISVLISMYVIIFIIILTDEKRYN